MTQAMRRPASGPISEPGSCGQTRSWDSRVKSAPAGCSRTRPQASATAGSREHSRSTPRAQSNRGFSLTLQQTIGAAASGGMQGLLGQSHLEGLAANDNGDELEQRNLELKMGYGVALFDDRFTGTPELGLGVSNGHRKMSLGWRLALERAGPVSMELGVEATRHEATNNEQEPVNALMLRTQIRW